MLQGSLPLWWFYWDRIHTHMLTYTRSIWNKNFLQGEAQREQKCQGVFLAFTKLTADLFVSVSKTQLVFSLRERRQERRIGLGWPYDSPLPAAPPPVRHGNSFSGLDFGWIVLLPRGGLCRSNCQAFGSNTWSVSEHIQVPQLPSASLSLRSPPLMWLWRHVKLIISPVTSSAANTGQYWIIGNANAIFSSLIASPVPSETFH